MQGSYLALKTSLFWAAGGEALPLGGEDVPFSPFGGQAAHIRVAAASALKRCSIYAYKCSFSYYGRGIQPIPSLFEVSSLLNYWAFLLLWACFQNRYYLVFKYMDSIYWATVLAISEFCWLRHHYHPFNHYHKNHKLSEKKKIISRFYSFFSDDNFVTSFVCFFLFFSSTSREPGKPHISVCIF